MNEKKKQVLWFWGIVLLFGLTRFFALSSAGSFWFDEAFSVYFASKPFSELWAFLQFEHNPLLHFLSLHGWGHLFGATELSARILSALAGFVSLLGLYWLGKKLFKKEAGLWAMFLMTVSSLFLYHQTEARMYSFVFLFGILSVGTSWNYLESKEKKTRSKWLVAYTLSTLCLVHTHLTVWVLPIALFLFWVFESRKEWKGFMLANGIIIASFLLWFIPVMQNKFLAGHISQGWFFFQNEGGYLLTHLSNFLVNGEASVLLRSLSSGLILFLLTAALVAWEKPGLLRRIKQLFQQTRIPFAFHIDFTKQVRLLLTILIVGFGFGLALQITVTKYLMLLAIPVLLLLAKGLCAIPAKAKTLTASLLLIVALPMQLQLSFVKRHHFDEVADQIKMLVEENPDMQLISHSFVWALPLSFYDHGPKEIIPFYPLDDELSLEERIVKYNWQGIVNSDNVDLLSEITKDQAAVLLISSTPNSDERDPVKQWMYQNNWRLDKIVRWGGYGNPELILFRKDK